MSSPENPSKKKLSSEDSSKITIYWEKATHSGLHSQARQQYLDSILAITPDSAFFWQQKAMPLYKDRKYSLAKPFLAKAVEHNPKSYLNYSAFMKCLFSKEYEESIAEFIEVKERYGDSYVMDHTYNFYIGLNYLQLNKFRKAKEFLEKSKVQQFADFPDDQPEEACHYLDWFYLGIADFELGDYEKAIENFDISLKVYANFADAMYYKGASLYRSGREEKGGEWIKKARENAENTINEDQVFYEIYPYQVFHRLSPLSRAK
ncbi:tetratricopeptide repeat protein [Zobellia laminariae]|uniref:tetratricopeptide repeat protein n=1 Tax=Zobellia laminariae TaxID=248906 RepID=UPI0040563FE1